MTETIRFGLIGYQDIDWGTGTSQVTLADGSVVTMNQVPYYGIAQGDIYVVTNAPYNADNTGATDATTAISNAVGAAAAAGGGLVFFPAGTYLVDNFAIGNNVHLMGAGMGATILKCTRTTGSNYLGIVHNSDQTNGNTDLSVRDMTLWRSEEVAGGGVFDELLYFKKCTRVTIERVRILGTIDEASHAGKGVHLDGCTQTITRGCWFQDIPDNAWGANPQTSWTEGYHSVIDNTFVRTSETNINSQVLFTVHYVSVIGNRFIGPTMATPVGNWIECGRNAPTVAVNLRGCRIIGNHVTQLGSLIGALNGGLIEGNTVYLGSLNAGSDAAVNNATDLSIIGNTVVGGAITCNNTDGLVVANNTVDGTTTTNLDGIEISGCSDYIIANNRVNNTERNGIQVLTCTAPGRIVGNRAYNCATNATADDSGLLLDSPGAGIVIEGNESIDDGSVQPHALYINGGTNLTLRNNVLSGAAGTVFRDDATSYRTRSGNFVSGVPDDDGVATYPSGTGITVERLRDVIQLTYSYTAWQTAGLTNDKTLLVTTAGTLVTKVVARTTTAFVGTTTTTLQVGYSSGGEEYIPAHDVKTAALVRGIAAPGGEGGVLSGATIPATTIYARMTSTVDNLSLLSAGSVTFYLTVERLY